MATPTFEAKVRIAVGLGILLTGVVFARHARLVADLSEMLDAVGSTNRAATTRAADWNVTLTRYGGVAAAVAGLLWALTGVLYFL